MNLKYIVLLFCMLTLSCCVKEKVEPLFNVGTYIGTITVDKDGSIWDSKIQAIKRSNSSKIRITLAGFEEETGFKRESLSFHIVDPRRSEKIKLNILDYDVEEDYETTYTTILGHGDVGGDRYLLDTTLFNWIEITSYDSIARQVAGEFSASFTFEELLDNGETYFDTLHFTNGKFEAEIQE